ncbi:ATP-dependent Lon protease [Archaeoglobales archaeon]|nr:MAG: ATP-dependent Lon protease [Archaeoglobales archaeon]
MDLDELDNKTFECFEGKIVRKDLVSSLKGQINVPTYVLEYLLGKYCSSSDEEVIEAGLQEVKRILSEHYVRPDQVELFKAKVRELGKHQVIDKVKVRLVETEDKYWASLVNLQIDKVNIGEDLVYKYERLLAGGVWAVIELSYDSTFYHRNELRPFVIENIKPIQLASGNVLKEIKEYRKDFTREEWLNLILRSTGLEPNVLSNRLKMLHIARLIPFVENNYNLVELGPRGTGKSYVYRELSPYSILVSGGDVTVASLFVSLSGRGRIGLVGLWDVVAFDEIAGLTKLANPQAINILKDYMESGSFSRGREEITALASLVFVGNINLDVETALRTSHLFVAFPYEMQDLAFLDRFHAYLPGWEFPKMKSDMLTNHYGLVVDYLAEILRELRKLSFGDAIDQYFELGKSLNKRDEKAVRKTVSGFIKLLHPDGEFTQEDVESYLKLAIEFRRRVKEQLKRMGGIEYWNTALSFIGKLNGREYIVSLPEQRVSTLISPDPLPPGTVYTVGLDVESGKYALFRIEVAKMKGSGYTVTGAVGRAMKEAVRTAYDYLRSNITKFTIDKSLDDYNVHLQVVNIMQAKEGSQTASAFFVALYSSLMDVPIKPGTVVLGEITIQGGVLPVQDFAECVQLARENGARRVIVPISNSKDVALLPPELLQGLEISFYSDPKECLIQSIEG